MLFPLLRDGAEPAFSPAQVRSALQYADEAVESASKNAPSVLQALRAIVGVVPVSEHERWLRCVEKSCRSLVRAARPLVPYAAGRSDVWQ